MRFTSLLVMLLGVSAGATACSEPAAQGLMEAARQMAQWGAVSSRLLVLLALLLRRWAAVMVCLALFAVHPAWTMSPYHGDYGGSQEGSALFVALLSIAAFAWDLLRRRATGYVLFRFSSWRRQR